MNNTLKTAVNFACSLFARNFESKHFYRDNSGMTIETTNTYQPLMKNVGNMLTNVMYRRQDIVDNSFLVNSEEIININGCVRIKNNTQQKNIYFINIEYIRNGVARRVYTTSISVEADSFGNLCFLDVDVVLGGDLIKVNAYGNAGDVFDRVFIEFSEQTSVNALPFINA